MSVGSGVRGPVIVSLHLKDNYSWSDLSKVSQVIKRRILAERGGRGSQNDRHKRRATTQGMLEKPMERSNESLTMGGSFLPPLPSLHLWTVCVELKESEMLMSICGTVLQCSAGKNISLKATEVHQVAPGCDH